MSKIRLDRFLSSQLNISRTDAKKMLRTGKVLLNLKAVQKADIIIDTDSDSISVNGKKIDFKEYIYIMQNKPVGVVSATNDPSEKTVIDILPDSLKRKGLFPAGRLDKDTVGFVLITDNGDFAHNILSPSHHVKKTYIAEVQTKLDDKEAERFAQGMIIGDEVFKPAMLKLLNEKSENGNFLYLIKIVEGRYHQIKRMFISAGSPICSLKRVAIGGLELDENLMPGESKELTSAELQLIFN